MIRIIAIALLMLSVASAMAETVTLEIPDEYVPALVESAVTEGDYSANAMPGETELEFAKRMVVKAIAKRHTEIQLKKARMAKIAELTAQKAELDAAQDVIINSIQVLGTSGTQ